MSDDTPTDPSDESTHGVRSYPVRPDGGAAEPPRDLQLDAEELLASYPESRSAGQLAERITLPARDGEFVPPGEVLPAELAASLPFDLWSHQAAGIERLRDGENVVVSTGTSSGKTLIFALDVARRYLERESTRALLVYPTKALSRDQERELADLFQETLGLDITVGVYDGDTSPADKRRIREEANVVITNVVGLNQYLESHHLWARFYADCELVVIDEAHTWSGLSGMHVAWTLRRLQRVLDAYGQSPQYALTTATIGNPAAHARTLTGEDATVVEEDGSPRGRRELLFWEPPADDSSDAADDPAGSRERPGDEADRRGTVTESTETDAESPTTADESTRTNAESPGVGSESTQTNANSPGTGSESTATSKRPATVEAPEVWAHLCYHGVPSLLFCDSRKLTELAVDRAREFLTDPATPYRGGADLAPYNAGHGKGARRETETRLKTGDLDGVATTSALEVGINVGGVDGTVLLGYPGSRQSFWQRIGRSGRDGRDALSVFVPNHATLDEYVLRHPEYVLEEEPEDAVADLSNNTVYLQHVAAAAQELPLTDADASLFGGHERLERAVAYGRRTGDLAGVLDGGVTYDRRDRPQDEISFYATGGNAFEVRLAGDDSIDHQPIGRDRAYRDYHEGATVRYRGEQYQVRALREDVPTPYVELERTSVDYYTQSQGQVSIYDTDVRERRSVGEFDLYWGYGTVAVHYRTYLKRGLDTGEVLETGLATGVPELELRTQLCWVEVPDRVERALVARHDEYHNEDVTAFPAGLHGYLGGIHAVEHAMIGVAPLELNVDAADLGGLATSRLPGTAESSGWFVYDGIDGGLGFSRGIYEHYEAVARRARGLIRDCGCGRVDGCPACIMDDRCGNDNQPLYAPAATDVLDSLLGETDDGTLSEWLPESGGVALVDDRRPPADLS